MNKKHFQNLDISKVQEQFRLILEIPRGHISDFNTAILYRPIFDSYGFNFQPQSVKGGDTHENALNEEYIVLAVFNSKSLELISCIPKEQTNIDIKADYNKLSNEKLDSILKENNHNNMSPLKKEIISKQYERAELPSNYFVFSNLDDIYCDYELNANGQHEPIVVSINGVPQEPDEPEDNYEEAVLNGKFLVTKEEYFQLIEEYRESKYPTTWNEISEDRYYDMLEALPPQNWRTENGVSIFQMEEKAMGDITSTFAKHNNKFYESFQKTSVDYNKISKEIINQPQTDAELVATLKAYNEANEPKPTTTLTQS